MAGRRPPRHPHDLSPRWELVSLRDLYRVRPYPKPRAARRHRRRAARQWAALSPADRAMHTFIRERLMEQLRAEEDRQILYGDGTGAELTGIL
jgi:hypothetical protein